MIAVALRCFFFLGAIVFYSTGIWNMINGYFGKEFQTYLTQHPPPLPKSLPTIKTTIEAAIENMGENDGTHCKMKLEMMDSCGRYNMLEVPSPPTVAMRHADDGALIMPSEPNENPIDETWWNNYYREYPRGSRSKGAYENYVCPTSDGRIGYPLSEDDVVVDTDAVHDEADCAWDCGGIGCDARMRNSWSRSNPEFGSRPAPLQYFYLKRWLFNKTEI